MQVEPRLAALSSMLTCAVSDHPSADRSGLSMLDSCCASWAALQRQQQLLCPIHLVQRSKS